MILNADALEIPLGDESVQCVVTSPPYWGLRDYGNVNGIGLERTLEAYLERMVNVFREVSRVLRDDGTVWLNIGDAYCTGTSGGRQGQTGQRANRRFTAEGLGKTIPTGLKAKDLMGIPWRLAFALQADGWYLRSDIIWSKPNPQPESMRDRPTRTYEHVFLLAKSAHYFYDQDAVREPHTRLWNQTNGGSWAYGKGDTQRVAERGKAGTHSGEYPLPNPKGRNIWDVWSIPTASFGEAHFATFPPALVIPCIKAGSAENDVVLDPFAGSGTVGVVARKLVRSFVGLELNPAYCDMATRRIDRECPANLFDEVSS